MNIIILSYSVLKLMFRTFYNTFFKWIRANILKASPQSKFTTNLEVQAVSHSETMLSPSLHRRRVQSLPQSQKRRRKKKKKPKLKRCLLPAKRNKTQRNYPLLGQRKPKWEVTQLMQLPLLTPQGNLLLHR